MAGKHVVVGTNSVAPDPAQNAGLLAPPNVLNARLRRHPH